MSVGSLLGRALVPTAVAIVFALGRRYMPAAKPPDHYVPEPDGVVDNGSASPASVNGATVLVMLAIAFGGHALLVFMNRAYAGLEGPAAMRIYPQSAIWWFLPGFAGLCLSYEIVIQVWRRTPGRYSMDEYIKLTNADAGFDSRRMLRRMGVVIVLPIGVATLLAIPQHQSFTDTGIIDKGYGFSSAEIYQYSGAQHLIVGSGPSPQITIRFDKATWVSTFEGDASRPTSPDLIAFLASKTGLQVEPVSDFTEHK